MWAFLNPVISPIRAKANQFARDQAAAAVRKSGLGTLRNLRSGSGLTSELAALKLTLNTPVIQRGIAGVTGITAVDVANKTGLTGKVETALAPKPTQREPWDRVQTNGDVVTSWIEGNLNKVGPALDRFFSGTPQAIQQFGAQQEKKGWGGALEMASPLGFLAAPLIPSSATASPAPVNPRPIASLPADYKKTELQAGAAAEAFRPGAGFPGQQQFSAPAAPRAASVPQLSPQDRAYQQERARVEAMVKSNPDMQKQEIAEARAKVRDKGMEEWAKANPELAAKVMPGQSGFSAIQGFVGGIGAPTTGPTSAVLQASPELNPASPTFAGGEGAPILRELSPELIKQYQEQLLKQAK